MSITCGDLGRATASLQRVPLAIDLSGCLPAIPELGRAAAANATAALSSTRADLLAKMDEGLDRWAHFGASIIDLSCPAEVEKFLCTALQFTEYDRRVTQVAEFEKRLYREGLQHCLDFAEGVEALAPFAEEMRELQAQLPPEAAEAAEPLHRTRRALAEKLLKDLPGEQACAIPSFDSLELPPAIAVSKKREGTHCPSLKELDRLIEKVREARDKNAQGIQCAKLALARLHMLKSKELFVQMHNEIGIFADSSEAERTLARTIKTDCPREFAALIDRYADAVGFNPEATAFLRWADRRERKRIEHCTALFPVGSPFIEELKGKLGGSEGFFADERRLASQHKRKREDLRAKAEMLRLKADLLKDFRGKKIDWQKIVTFAVAAAVGVIGAAFFWVIQAPRIR